MRFKDGPVKIALKKEQAARPGPRGYLESIMSSMTDALIVVNPDATLRSANRSALDLLGYTEVELVGRPVAKIFLPEEKDLLHKFLDKIVVAGVGYTIGLNFLTKQGKAIPVEFSGALIQQDGKVIGTVGLARDMRQIMAIISDLERKDRDLEEHSKDLTRMQKAMLHIMGDLDIAKKEMEKANKELRKLDELKSDFVASVSHELRTPLTVTREAISQVLDGVYGDINEEQKRFLSMSIEGIDRLSRLIGNLLDISKIEAHKIKLNRELTDIVSLAKDVSANFAPALRSKGLETTYNFPEDRIELYLDKDRIIQVFVNLLSNALKFTPSGRIEISIADRADALECAVSDTGVGISDNDLPRVFNKFDQFGREFESAQKGTGLGLAISKGIVELHHGEIRVESKLGRGTKVSFTLPKYTPRELFKEYVADGLAVAARENSSLSIIVFEVKNYDALQEKLGQDKIASLVQRLGLLIRTDLRRKSDISINDNRTVLVALPETDKKGACATAERLKSIFESSLAKEGLASEIEVELRVPSFPEDASTEEELLRKIQL
jgi:PAS domain S-box-containing protein